jgi:hypothetical protein
MQSIVTLSWSNGVAYGPKGTRYELENRNGLWATRVYSDDTPHGAVIANGEGTKEGAMLAAQRNCEALTAIVESEHGALDIAGGRIVG